MFELPPVTGSDIDDSTSCLEFAPGSLLTRSHFHSSEHTSEILCKIEGKQILASTVAKISQ